MSRLMFSKNSFISKLEFSVVILDLGASSIYALNKIKSALKTENIIYINDYEDIYSLEKEKDMVVDIAAITDAVKRIKECALKYKPKLIIVLSDTIIEYGREEFLNIGCKVCFINDVIIEDVNENFEFKNMAFFSKQSIIEANLYQPNFHYTRLYNLNADNMINSITGFKMKTSESFNEVKIALLPLYKKDVDVIIPSLANILMFETEILEYARENNNDPYILKIDDLIANSAYDMIKDDLNEKIVKKPIYILEKVEKKPAFRRELRKKEKEKRKLYNKALSYKYRFVYEKS